MTSASPRADRTDRLVPWFGACCSVLLHLLFLMLLLFAVKPTISTPQGAESGSRVRVSVAGQASSPPTPTPPPPSPAPTRTNKATPDNRPRPDTPRTERESARNPPVTLPVQPKRVVQAGEPSPADAATPPDPQPSTPPPEPSDIAAPAQTIAPPPSAARDRYPKQWTGRPPGMLDEDLASENAGLANSSAINPSNRRDRATAAPSLETGGYQVYYDLRSEARIRALMDQGMTEVAMLLPGTQYRMACPLEIALRRGSGKCRLLAPDSPELKDIGDALEVINMVRVYKQGEVVWDGPGPYR